MTWHHPNLQRVLASGITLITLLWAGYLLAHSGGQVGVSQAADGCRCHSSSPDANGDVTVDIQGPQTVAAGATETYTISVSGQPAGTTGGFNLSSDGGTLIAGANSQLDGGELTHVDENSRSWTFEWEAPPSEGTVNFFAVGQATNGSGTGGDSWDWYGGAQSTAFQIDVTAAVGIEEGSTSGFSLSTPRPNPSAGSTRIEFSLPQAAAARLEIFDAKGRRIETLVSGVQPAGRQAVVWDGTDSRGSKVASGVYLIRLQAGSRSVNQRVTRIGG